MRRSDKAVAQLDFQEGTASIALDLPLIITVGVIEIDDVTAGQTSDIHLHLLSFRLIVIPSCLFHCPTSQANRSCRLNRAMISCRTRRASPVPGEKPVLVRQAR